MGQMTTQFTVSSGIDHLDMSLVHRCLSTESYWAKDRSYDDVKKSFENSLCFGLHHPAKSNLVGFCRVVTDYVAFAYLMDLFVIPPHVLPVFGPESRQKAV